MPKIIEAMCNNMFGPTFRSGVAVISQNNQILAITVKRY